MDTELARFFDEKDGIAISIKSKVQISDCRRCEGGKSKFMFTIDAGVDNG